jgi:hypothetical protein
VHLPWLRPSTLPSHRNRGRHLRKYYFEKKKKYLGHAKVCSSCVCPACLLGIDKCIHRPGIFSVYRPLPPDCPPPDDPPSDQSTQVGHRMTPDLPRPQPPPGAPSSSRVITNERPPPPPSTSTEEARMRAEMEFLHTEVVKLRHDVSACTATMRDMKDLMSEMHVKFDYFFNPALFDELPRPCPPPT